MRLTNGPISGPSLAVAFSLLTVPGGVAAPSPSELGGSRVDAVDARAIVTTIVGEIRRADYEGDRATLRKLHADLSTFKDDGQLGTRVLYWRGFARWRAALNGFNDAADPAELEADLAQCVTDFKEVLSRDGTFVDARAGAGSCLMNQSFLAWRMRQMDRATALRTEAYATMYQAFLPAGALENPRLLWVHGTHQWYGATHEAAVSTYARALDLARHQAPLAADSLDPAWGEAEILMNLSFASLNRKEPDLIAARRFAKEALALVPRWHYVRDLLLPQIEQRLEADIAAGEVKK